MNNRKLKNLADTDLCALCVCVVWMGVSLCVECGSEELVEGEGERQRERERERETFKHLFNH